MNRLPVDEILKKNESRYSLVIAVAKRAREIAEEAEQEGEILIEKPVELAMEDFIKGNYKLIEKKDIGKEIE